MTTFVSEYLFLGDSMILSLPGFHEVTCNQQFPENPLTGASAGVVMENGKKELLVCGGKGTTICQLWTEGGWVAAGTGFNR